MSKENVTKEIAKVINWTCAQVRTEMDMWENRGYIINRDMVEKILEAIIKA